MALGCSVEWKPGDQCYVDNSPSFWESVGSVGIKPMKKGSSDKTKAEILFCCLKR